MQVLILTFIKVGFQNYVDECQAKTPVSGQTKSRF